ncbi:MAG: BREX system ATP-binding protein BrxD [Deltaproteobacteria bacterium]|nr:BREX system ATP-binding protein BrxD [Deltaproteobacteria bacterium]
MVELRELSLGRRKDIIAALRNGAVPSHGLEQLAVGLEAFDKTLVDELTECTTGRGRFKAVRGEYGTGKTFFSRYMMSRALQQGMAVSLVQVSEVDTPLYKLETVYRRAMEHLATKEWDRGTFRQLVERWFFDLEEEVLSEDESLGEDPKKLHNAVSQLLESRLAEVARDQPQFSMALRAAHEARLNDDAATFDGLIGWLMGQPQISSAVKRKAGLKSDLDHTGALAFLRGLLILLKQTGRPGMLLVLDEVETIQRVRSDSREKSLNALRQLIDAVADGSYPGLYLLITGTPQFFDGPQGVKRLQPLAMRLATEFSSDPKFDNPRSPQIRLHPFNVDKLTEVGIRVRDLFPADEAKRVQKKVTDEVIQAFAKKVAGKFGGQVGMAPRIYLKKLVDLIDKVDLFPDFDPVKDYKLQVSDADGLTPEEAQAANIERSAADIVLDLE